MLHPADVVLGEVGEHPHGKGEAVDPQILQADGGSLHHAVAAAGVGHAAQIHLYIVAHGGGVVGLDELLAHEHPNGANDAGLVAGGLQDGANHIGGGGLALGACHADDGDVPLCGVLKESGAQQGQGLAGVRHQDHLGAGGLYRLLRHDDGGPGLGGPGGILVAVGVGAPHAHKGAALFCLAGVVYNIGNFNFLITLCNAQRGQQTRQFHKKHFLSRGKAWAYPCKSTDLSYSFTKFLSIKTRVSAGLVEDFTLYLDFTFTPSRTLHLLYIMYAVR